MLDTCQHLEESLELAEDLLRWGVQIDADGLRWSRAKWQEWRQEIAGHVAAARADAQALMLLTDTGGTTNV